ncbi:hypothetical protein F7430_22760 [Salmonella enterica]|nr:hypothetical protein [Salmonella enterica]
MPDNTVKKSDDSPVIQFRRAINVEKDGNIIEPTKPCFTHTLADMIAKMTPKNTQGAVDWGKPIGEEVWEW